MRNLRFCHPQWVQAPPVKTCTPTLHPLLHPHPYIPPFILTRAPLSCAHSCTPTHTDWPPSQGLASPWPSCSSHPTLGWSLQHPGETRAAGHTRTRAGPLPQPRNQPRPAPCPFRGGQAQPPPLSLGTRLPLLSHLLGQLRRPAEPQQSGKGDPALMSACTHSTDPFVFPDASLRLHTSALQSDRTEGR